MLYRDNRIEYMADSENNAAEKKEEICSNCNKDTKQKSNKYKIDAWWVIGFVVPLAGLILYLAWKTKEPEKARSAGYGALIGAVAAITSLIFKAIFG